jgi:hypothetical protein
MPLATPGSGSISLDGLDPMDRLRISQVGFKQWLDEVSKEQEQRIARATKKSYQSSMSS